MGSFRAVKVGYRKTFESEGRYEREFSGIKKFEPISRSHEGFVDILQVGRDDAKGYFYYVMELADDAREQTLIRDKDSSRVGEESADTTSSDSLANDPVRTDYSPKKLSSEVRRRERL